MRPVNILSKSLLTVGTVLGLIFAQSAAALVTIDATTAAVGPVLVGETFDVVVTATYDGAAGLAAVFSSHQWDNTQLMLVDAFLSAAPALETRPSIFAGGSFDPPALTRNGTIAAGIAGDDLTSTARTVQYSTGGLALGAGNASAGQEVTTLRFEVVGVGDGIANIDGFINTGDAGAVGDTFAFGTAIAITVPEPSSALLGLSALGCVFAVVSVRRRD